VKSKGIIAAIASIVVIAAIAGGSTTGSPDSYESSSEKTYQSTSTHFIEKTTVYETSIQPVSYSQSEGTIPDYHGNRVEIINNDVPYFTDEEKIFNGTFINLSELDALGRCGVANSCVGLETRTTEKRGSISSIYPSGWKQLQLSNGEYLYNRSHLLMYALTGINSDRRNLITGTQQFNASTKFGMLAYETQILWIVDNFNAHVLYRVTPYFEGNDLVAKGVLMEAYCIEYPEECEFCVFIYNVQDGVDINYATGEAHEITSNQTKEESDYVSTEQSTQKNTVVVPQNPKSGEVMVWIPVNGGTKYHNKQTCSNMKDPIQVSIEQAIDSGYEPCKKCFK